MHHFHEWNGFWVPNWYGKSILIVFKCRIAIFSGYFFEICYKQHWPLMHRSFPKKNIFVRYCIVSPFIPKSFQTNHRSYGRNNFGKSIASYSTSFINLLHSKFIWSARHSLIHFQFNRFFLLLFKCFESFFFSPYFRCRYSKIAENRMANILKKLSNGRTIAVE